MENSNENQDMATEEVTEETTVSDSTDWKAEARKWEARAKANRDAAQRLEEFEEAQKSESERQASRLAKAEARLAEYEAREKRAEWAKEITEGSQVPASVLRGSTREEMEEHFEELKAVVSVHTTGRVPGIEREPKSSGGDTSAFLAELFKN